MGGKVEVSSTSAVGVYSPVDDVPTEVLANIFSRLPNWDLGACTLVCRYWKNGLNETEGLKQLFMCKFPSVALEGIIDADLKKEYIRRNRLDWNYRLGLYVPYVLRSHPIGGQSHSVMGLLFAGREIIFAVAYGSCPLVKIWDTIERECKGIIFLKGETHGVCMAAAANKIFFDAASPKGMIKVWNRTLHAWVRSLKGHTEEVTVLATAEIISDSGKRKMVLISGAADMKIMIWNTDDQAHIKTLEGHKAKITALAVGNDRLFSGSEDGIIMAWDLNSFECKGSVQGPQGIITSFAVDKNRLFSTFGNKSIVAWDMNNLTQIAALEGSASGILFVIADHFLISSEFSEMKIWDLDNFECIATLPDPGHFHSALAAKDGKLYSGDPCSGQLLVRDFRLGLSAVLMGIAKELKDQNRKHDATLALFNRLPEHVKKKIKGERSEMTDLELAEAIDDYVEGRTIT